ncbi:MAG: heparinase, partial [Syntrophus sp. (in: bacteria)]|nr:heparinase [Syntrophus sp. (in: bacteria)]
MKNPFVLYLRTSRYLKPVQVFGRIWFRLQTPSVRIGPPPPIRRRAAEWASSPLKSRALLSPSRFRLLNEEHEIKDPSDWNNPQWAKLWLYHLHYFDDLNADGAGLRTAWHASLIERWIAENPVGRGNGWEPYPLSRRIVNWIEWTWAGNELPLEAAASLAVQSRYLRKRLEWHILGNHLLANAKALIFAGLFFEGPGAEGLLAIGASIFSRQLAEQVLADGGHF